ncbi:uncharacterized protein BDW43DRAFT_307881 [Aspergillus alliaceus]|uniref:uncharacterized protein n=1 Tax=Petromyces alliaceus TaxID=209559 RepID=UPI0012A4BA6F|nr:uncharacterized protein BDW43DRAFT_307881 [Aspergillus alliaceus]KAB8236866.1 hypothetical protein BDW43DRAFT_307881 [Aspergillus alliaceus]
MGLTCVFRGSSEGKAVADEVARKIECNEGFIAILELFWLDLAQLGWKSKVIVYF